MLLLTVKTPSNPLPTAIRRLHNWLYEARTHPCAFPNAPRPGMGSKQRDRCGDRRLCFRSQRSFGSERQGGGYSGQAKPAFRACPRCGRYYRFPILRVGEYRLMASAPSFGEYRQEGIVLTVGREARLNITFSLASTSETVTVKADA